MYYGAGQQENETRRDYLKRLKREIIDPEYLERALDELALHLTKGVEKGIFTSDGTAPDAKKKKE